MAGIGFLMFSIGLLFCGVAFVGELFNVVGRQRQVVEGFEWYLINTINLCFFGAGVISLYVGVSLLYGSK